MSADQEVVLKVANPGHALRALALKVLALILLGTVLGFAVNALNPHGINLRIAWGLDDGKEAP